MLSLKSSGDRIMVAGLTSVDSEVRQTVRAEVWKTLSSASSVGEPDRVYYNTDGRLDAASWQVDLCEPDAVKARIAQTLRNLQPTLN